jgi:acyl carrier protein
MNRTELIAVIHETFPGAIFDEREPGLGIGSFPQWDSLGNFNLLLQVEAAAGIRFDSQEIAEIKTLEGVIAALRKRGVYAD